MARAAWSIASGAMAVLLTLPAAAGYSESEAPSLGHGVVQAWHSPDVMGDRTWSAYLRTDPTAGVTGARFQVCLVGKACFAPPAPAQALGNGTFGFSSEEAAAGGTPLVLSATDSHHIGVKWYLESANGTTQEFPPDPTASPVCTDAAAPDCQEAHYVTFWTLHRDVAAPAGPLGAFLALACAALARARRRHA